MNDHHLKNSVPMPDNQWKATLDAPMLVGESPLWEPNESTLYWIDIADLAIHRLHSESRKHDRWSLPSEPGCIARRDGGGLVVAMRSGLAFLDTASGALISFADVPYDPSQIRFNDGRCDAAGRLWAGTLFDSRKRAGGSLFCIEHGKIRDLGIPATVSNGIAFSTDNRTLYRADTTAHRISAYDFDLNNGKVGNGRLFHQFSADKNADYGGRPDGAAIDSEGAYWVAMYEGGKILRFSPTGEVLRELILPVRCPTMLAFGGPDLRTMYVTTASHNRPASEIKQFPLSGYLLELQVEVPGRIEPVYVP